MSSYFPALYSLIIFKFISFNAFNVSHVYHYVWTLNVLYPMFYYTPNYILVLSKVMSKTRKDFFKKKHSFIFSKLCCTPIFFITYFFH